MVFDTPYLQNELGDPRFFLVFNLILSFSTCSQSFKKICTWELLGTNVLKCNQLPKCFYFNQIYQFSQLPQSVRLIKSSRFYKHFLEATEDVRTWKLWFSAFSKIWSRCLPFASTRRSWWKGPQGPFSSSRKCKSTAGDLQESTRRSSGGSRVLLKALYSY